MKFSLTEEEMEKFRVWYANHGKTCQLTKRENQGAAGGAVTYAFTPTGLGEVCEIICACGEKINVTDYDSW